MFGLCKRNRNPIEIERRFRANDPAFNSQFQYADNHISTSKYNVVTFLPKNLFEQFQRIANAYFLFLLILQLIPQISSLSFVTTVIPLAAVLAFTALKDLIDDVQRHRSDNQVNNRMSWLLREGKLIQVKWRHIAVGDIVKMENDQFVTADVLLLSTSEPNSLCYIETAALDGETNLKVRQALTETSQMQDNIKELSTFDGEVLCEAPNNVLSKFEGRLSWEGQTYSLDNDKILLRGCRLRNTEWCFGLVVFAGKDTKLMMNCGETKFKRTHIDRLMNLLIIGIFIFLIAMCLICAICCAVWEVLVGGKFQLYLPWENFVPGREKGTGAGAVVIATLIFFSYIIVLNTVVPISLYVSVEMIRFGHSWWINWDREMYDASKDTSAKSRTTTLNEELGQIEFIFSDKTGTLTQNVMTFNKCSIGGKSYGDPVDDQGMARDVTEKTPTVDFSENPMSDPSFQFYDERLWHLAVKGDDQTSEFFRLLALCHTVMPEEKDGQLIYQAQSPDEGALVSAARNFGFVFKSRTPNTITIEVFGEEEVHELLSILDFNNVRKRMSVILRRQGRIRLYCKGADSTIFERLHPKCSDLKQLTTSHLNDFAQDGLRTLCCAIKDIDPHYYESWKIRHHEATTSLRNREDLVDVVCEEIERDLVLVGASAIEDKLQDGVPETIANLALAGIKIWVLTGDKQETAINIGYSCRLLTEDMEELFLIDGEKFEDVEKQLTNAKEEMDTRREEEAKILLKTRNSTVEASGGGAGIGGSEFGLVINGSSLAHALTEKLESLLLEVGCQCRAVICCRVTPLQKALVVELVKRQKKSVTLAIGDGANDVSMIKAAHIGVGISGQEGMQAVLASDFSFAQFRFLERLLLVHGRWSYLRMAKFLRYFFYKNFAFTLCHFWFAFYCGFSAQTVYDPYFISFYNLFFTSLPVLALGLLDQDVNDKLSRIYPRLYTPGQRDLFFNKRVFGRSVVEGIITSLVLFFVPYLTFKDCVNDTGLDLADHRALGFVIASILIVVVTLRCALETSHWTGVNHFVTWGSIVFYFVFILIFYSKPFGYSYEGVATTLMATVPFWFSLFLCIVILLVPVLMELLYRRTMLPTLTDRVRLLQKRSRTAVAAKPRIIRRASSSRRSQRSLGRSGYAFAHQGGFGELITSGSMMHLRPKTPAGSGERVGRAITSAAGVLTTVAVTPLHYHRSPGFDNNAYDDGEKKEEKKKDAHAQSPHKGKVVGATGGSFAEGARSRGVDSGRGVSPSSSSFSDANSRPISTASRRTESQSSDWKGPDGGKGSRDRGNPSSSDSPIRLELRERTNSEILEEDIDLGEKSGKRRKETQMKKK